MSIRKKQASAASENNEAERNINKSRGFSPELFEERVEVNLEPFHAQISALAQMMDD